MINVDNWIYFIKRTNWAIVFTFTIHHLKHNLNKISKQNKTDVFLNIKSFISDEIKPKSCKDWNQILPGHKTWLKLACKYLELSYLYLTIHDSKSLLLFHSYLKDIWTKLMEISQDQIFSNLVQVLPLQKNT